MMRRDHGNRLDVMRGRVSDHALRRRDGPAAVAGLAWRALGPDRPTAPQLVIRSMFFAFSVGLYLLNAVRPGRIAMLYRVALVFDQDDRARGLGANEPHPFEGRVLCPVQAEPFRQMNGETGGRSCCRR